MGHEPNNPVSSTVQFVVQNVVRDISKHDYNENSGFRIPIVDLDNTFNSRTRWSGAASRDATDVTQQQSQSQTGDRVT